MSITDKYVCAILCILGIVGIGYGMERPNHIVFILGLLCVIAGYLMIRRHLKKAARRGN